MKLLKHSALACLVLATPLTFASAKFVSKEEAMYICVKTVNNIKHITGNWDVPCTDKVVYAAHVAEGACLLVDGGKYSDAASTLELSFDSLNEVYKDAERCAYYSSEAMRLMGDVRYAISAIKSI